MARTAKRYQEATQKKKSSILVYTAAIYARLSVDNDKKKSESIDTQIALIKEFVQKNNENPDRKYEIVIYGTYSDIGKTGTNFARDGFEQMMQDVRDGKVNCILVKDFSRFGRNYIETGNYLENILPFMRVRFISVCDNYDSFALDAKNQELSMNIKNLINDAYAKDIATKQRAAKRIAQKNGEYVGAKAPYGYCSEKVNGIYKLVIDLEPAKIVRRVFEEYASGRSIRHIVEGLFHDEVHRISDYNRYHHVYRQNEEELFQWSARSVCEVLRRNNYYGDLVQRKRESRFLRGEKGCDELDVSQWIVVPQTHEPIISRELFEKVQSMLNEAERGKNQNLCKADERAFFSVFYCGDCGRKMCTRKIEGRVSYYCGAYQYLDKRKCTSKVISENKMQKIVRDEIIDKFKLSKLRKKDMSGISNSVYEEKIKEIRKEIDCLDNETERRSRELAQIFMKYKEGNVLVDTYKKMKEERDNWKLFCEERKKELEIKIRKLQKQQKEESRFLRSLMDLKGTFHINADLAESLIERMYLYDDGRLEINFRFKEAVENE